MLVGVCGIEYNRTVKYQNKKRRREVMYFNYLDKADPEVAASIRREINRQETKIEMIASENFVN